jgi:PAS domain S-box-containing protein
MVDANQLASGAQVAGKDVSEGSQAGQARPLGHDIVARIMDTSPVGITVFDRQGRITFANRLVQDVAGQAGIPSLAGCAYNDPLWRLLTEDGEPLPDEALPFAQVMSSGQAVLESRCAIELPDGQRTYLSSNATPILDNSGEIDGVVVTTEDITARVLAEEQLRQSAKRHRQLLDALQEGIWEIDQDANTSFVNPRMAEMLGYSVEEMLGRPLFSFMDKAGVEACKRNLERRRQGIREQHDFQFLRKDGSQLYASLEASPIYDDEGRYAGSLAGVQDITERVRAEARLRDSEEKYRNLVEKVSDVIYALDIGGRITYVSPAVESCLGYSPEQLVGRCFRELVAPEDLARAEPRFRELASGRELGSTEYRVVAASGTLHWIRQSSQLILDGDRVIGVRGVLTDITERVRAEEQREAAAAAAERERLARDLHDAVTQSLFSVAAIAEALPSVWKRDQAEAWRGLKELRRLTSGALAEMRGLLLELRPSALTEQKLDVLVHQLTEAMTGRTRMPITTQVTGDCNLPVEARIALYRIAQEALNNVAKHARASWATVELHCEARYARLCISDDGRGFNPAAVQPRQLGLDIMRERAQAAGASLRIDSQPGQGTRVLVEWGDKAEVEHYE